jgi:hypothetical protein
MSVRCTCRDAKSTGLDVDVESRAALSAGRQLTVTVEVECRVLRGDGDLASPRAWKAERRLLAKSSRRDQVIEHLPVGIPGQHHLELAGA